MGGLRILHLEDNSDDSELIRITLSLAGIDAEIRLVASRQDSLPVPSATIWL